MNNHDNNNINYTYCKELVDIIDDTTKYIHILVTVEPALFCYPCIQLQVVKHLVFEVHAV